MKIFLLRAWPVVLGGLTLSAGLTVWVQRHVDAERVQNLQSQLESLDVALHDRLRLAEAAFEQVRLAAAAGAPLPATLPLPGLSGLRWGESPGLPAQGEAQRPDPHPGRPQPEGDGEPPSLQARLRAGPDARLTPAAIELLLPVPPSKGRRPQWLLAELDVVDLMAHPRPLMPPAVLFQLSWAPGGGAPQRVAGLDALDAAGTPVRFSSRWLQGNLEWQALPEREAGWLGAMAQRVGAAGVGFSLLLGALVGWTGRRDRLLQGRLRAQRDQAEPLAAYVQDSPQPLWQLGRDGSVRWANKAALVWSGGVTGFGRSVLEDLRPVQPQEGEALLLALQTLFERNERRVRPEHEAERPWQAECELTQAGGPPVWVVLALSYSAGAAWLTLAEAGEARRERQHLTALAAARGAWVKALDQHVAVVVTDLSGRILEANARFCALSGYELQELIGQTHRLINGRHHPDAFWTDFWQTLRAGRSWQGVLCNRSRSGTSYWVDCRVTPMASAQGEPDRYIAVSLDVTAQRQLQMALEQERDRLAAVVEGMQAGTWEWNYQTGRMRLNARALRLWGWPETASAVDALPWADLQARLLDEDAERFQQQVQLHLAGRSPVLACELRLPREGSGRRWAVMRGTVVHRTPTGEALALAGTLFDHDDQRQAEERLRVEKLVSDRTQRLAQVGGFELRLSDQRLTWSAECYRLHGLSPDSPLSLELALALVHPEDREALTAAMDRAVAKAEAWDLELRLLPAGGGLRWVRSVGETEFSDGVALRVVGAFQDIGQRRALEAEARRQQVLLRSVLDHLPCGVSVFDGDNLLQAANNTLFELLDLPPERMREGVTRYADMLAFNAARGEYGEGAERDARMQAMQQLVLEPIPHHFERTRPNGVVLDVRGVPLTGGGLVTTYIDISEAKRAEETLRVQERFLRLVADSVPGRIAYWSRSLRCVFANRAYAEGFGLTPDRLVGMTAEELDAKGAGAPAAGPGLAARLRGLQAVWAGSAMRFEEDDGQGGTLLVHAEPDRSDEVTAQVQGVILLALDISELKDAQTRAETLNAALAVERDRANEASGAKSQFLASMSHEIRTPMNAILGLLRLLRRTPLAVQQQDYVGKTEGAAKSLLGLLNDILDFSKVEAGKLDLDLHAFSTDELLRTLATIMSGNVGAKSIELVFDLDPALPAHLVGDPLRLQQVLINLVGNAIKFTDHGEVCLLVRVLGHDDAGDSVSTVRLGFAVRDSGIGIAPEQVEQIFEGFRQAEASTSRRYGGTGLGLAISQRLVRLMGGEINVSSQPGAGSTFAFELALPLAPAEPAPMRLQPLRVLLVEPHAGSRHSLQGLLQTLGVTAQAVAQAAEAEQALRDAQAAGQPFDVALVAMDLPDVSGWDCGQSLRWQQAGLRWVLSGSAALRELQEGRAQAPDAFLVKPVCTSLLREVLQAQDGAASRLDPDDAATPLAGLHVLVAEDNPNNQLVAQELLQALGARITLANDGSEALRALRESPSGFDLVLMDMQMPVLDGLEATRRIREDLGLRSLPILAMTANALPSDRQACLAAGMNDHVGKPFDLDDLSARIRAAVSARGGHAAVTPAIANSNSNLNSNSNSNSNAPETANAKATKPVSPFGPVPEVPLESRRRAQAVGLDLQAGLTRFLGRTELYWRTAQSLARQAEDLPARLREGMAASPPAFKALEQALHSIKGLSATVAHEGLAQWASVGEQRMRAQQGVDAEWIARFEVQLQQGLAVLVREAQTLHQPAPPPPPLPSARPAVLDRLSTLLRAQDVQVLTLLAEERAALQPWLGDRLEALEAHLASLDFEAALGVLEAQASAEH